MNTMVSYDCILIVAWGIHKNTPWNPMQLYTRLGMISLRSQALSAGRRLTFRQHLVPTHPSPRIQGSGSALSAMCFFIFGIQPPSPSEIQTLQFLSANHGSALRTKKNINKLIMGLGSDCQAPNSDVGLCGDRPEQDFL